MTDAFVEQQRSSAALDRDALDAIVAAARHARIVVVSHGLGSDAAGGREDIAQLSADLPAGWTRGVRGAAALVAGQQPEELGPVLPNQSDDPTVTRIYHVQHALRRLTDSVYDALEAAWPDDEPWHERDAGMFVTSDGAITPAHADRHHNLLLQLSGSKQVGVCPPGSREHAAVVARSLPSLHADRMPVETQVVELRAGQAIYMPPYSLHWVRSYEQAVALSCGWSSGATRRAADVHFANATLRRLGLAPRPVGSRHETTRLRLAAGARRARSLVH